MAKGWGEIEQQALARAAQSERFAAGFKPELKVNQNSVGPFQVRFLEQGPEINNFPVHEYKIPDSRIQGGFAVRRFTCFSEIHQECPGCNAGMRTKRRGVFNIIQRQRPQLRKDKDGKSMKNPDGSWIIDDWKDEVVIGNVGGPTANMVRTKDTTFNGLMSRDFIIQFSGDTFQAWSMDPAYPDHGALPMSEADFILAGAKHNLDEYMKPPTPQEAMEIIAKYGANSGVRGGAPQSSGPSHAASPPPQVATGFLAGSVVPAGAPVNAFGAAGQPPQAPAPVAPPAPQVPPAPGPPPVPATAPAPAPQAAPAAVPPPVAAPVQ